MKLSKALIALLREKHGLKADATEAEAKECLDAKLKSGELSFEDAFVAVDEAAKSASGHVSAVIAEALGPVLESVKTLAESNKTLGEELKAIKTAKSAEPPKEDKAGEDDLETKLNALLDKRNGDSEISPLELFKRTGVISAKNQPRVKAAVEGYSASRPDLDIKGFGAGMKLANIREATGKSPTLGSDRDNALIGAWWKFRLRDLQRQGMPIRGLEITDHDKQLYLHLLHEEKWCEGGNDKGENAIHRRKLQPSEVKALLDDSTSGGVNAVPLVYDDAVITTSILYGELFPFVNLTDLSRGQQIHAYQIGRPTLQANVNEGTAISLFDTTAFISSLDTTIYTAVGALEIGLDWQEDSPVNIGAMVVFEFGQAAKNYLDKVIAVGDGTTQPTGIFTATNTNLVPSTTGVGAPLSAGDFQSLYFGITKAERNRTPAYWCFVGSDGTYQRSENIPVGPSDARRLFNSSGVNAELGIGSYNRLGYPYKVCGDCTDSQMAYANLKRYRMYRRLGMNMRYETAGQTLALKNTAVVVFRMRFGGKPELGAGFAVMNNVPQGS